MSENNTNNKRIARNMVFNVGVFVVNLCISFFLSPYLIRTVGKEAYSFYPLISNLVGYTSIITTAVGSMAGRFITMELYGGNKREAQGYFNSVLFAYWLLSLVFGVLFFVGVIYIDAILTIPNQLVTTVRWMFALSAVSLLIGMDTGLLGIGTYIKNRIDLRASRDFTTTVIHALVIIVLFSLFVPNVVYVSVAGLCTTLIGVIFNIQFKKRLLPELKFHPHREHSWKKVRTLVSSGIWNSVNQLSNVLLTQLDLLITNIFISAAATGDYALAKMAPNIIYGLLAVLSGTFMPNFNILYAQGKMEELIHEAKKSMKIIGVIICLPIGFLLVFADEFFHLWVPSVDSDYLYWLSFLTVLPMIFGSSVNPIFGIFTITNRLRVPSLVLLIAGILNTTAVFLLLKFTSLGIWAIPIVAGVQHGLRNFFFTPIYAAVCLKQPLFTFYPTVMKCCLALASVAAIGLGVKACMTGDTWPSLFVEGVVMVLCALPLNMFVIMNKGERAYLFSTVKRLISR